MMPISACSTLWVGVPELLLILLSAFDKVFYLAFCKDEDVLGFSKESCSEEGGY